MGVSRKRKQFQLETLSMQGEVKAVDGLLVGFNVVMASGQVLQLQALKHHGLGKSGTLLRAKVLTVPSAFAAHWKLEQQSVTKPDASNVHNHIYTRQSEKLQLVVGMDLAHLFPTLLDRYRDPHGIVQIFNCGFSGRMVAAGNRTFPLTNQSVRNIIRRVDSSQGFFGTIYERTDNEGCPVEDETVSTLMCSLSQSVPSVPVDTPVVRAVQPQPQAVQPGPDRNCTQEEEQYRITELTPFSGDR